MVIARDAPFGFGDARSTLVSIYGFNVQLDLENIRRVEWLRSLSMLGIQHYDIPQHRAVLQDDVDALVPHTRLRKVGEMFNPTFR